MKRLVCSSAPGTWENRNPEKEYERQNFYVKLLKLLYSLPDGYRLPWTLRHLDGRSTDEIASRLGMNPSTVRTNVFRAARFLRRRLEISDFA